MGGVFGVIAFCVASDDLVHAWYWTVHKLTPKKRRENFYSQPLADIKGNPKIRYSYVSASKKPNGATTARRRFGVVFTPRNRRIVKLWQQFGLSGIAILTPILLSIPVGTFLATRLEKKRLKILLYMSIAIFFWAIIITSILFKFIPIPPEMITD